jgi:hypothetical protein
MNYKENKNVTVYGVANTASNLAFSAFLDVTFIPDEIRIKKLTIFDADTMNNVSNSMLLHTDMLYPSAIYNYKPIVTEDTTASDVVRYFVINDCPDIRYKITKPINSNFNFWITDGDGSVPSNHATFDTAVTIMFEFVKY